MKFTRNEVEQFKTGSRRRRRLEKKFLIQPKPSLNLKLR
jgi:hypothetical protein